MLSSPCVLLCVHQLCASCSITHRCRPVQCEAERQKEAPVTEPRVFEAAAAGCHRDFTADYRAEPSLLSFVQLSAFPQPQTVHRWGGMQHRGCHSQMQVCTGV